MATLATLPADAEQILTEFGIALTEAGVEVPERMYLNPGSLVAWDEPQLTIAVLRIYHGQPGQTANPSIPALLTQSVSLGVLFIFAVPALDAQGNLPATDVLDAAGQEVVTMAKVFWETAVALWAAGKLAPLNAAVEIGDVTPVGPQGALAGVSIQLDMSLL